MVTWTFDLTALFIGFIFGVFIGGLISILFVMRDGGAWSKGFFEGCDAQYLINYLKNEKERRRNGE